MPRDQAPMRSNPPFMLSLNKTPCIYDRGTQLTVWANNEAQHGQVPPRDLEQFSKKRSLSPFFLDYSGHTKLDPFQTYPSPLNAECITRVLTYSIGDMWPKIFPGMTYKGASFVDYWIKCAMSCPPLFNAWLHSGAKHMQFLDRPGCDTPRFTKREKYEILLMEREAILGLKEAVDYAVPERILDEHVMATLALALHPPDRPRGPAKPARIAPLSNLQLLSRFTGINISHVHVNALRHLVSARGGFDVLEMPGLKPGLASFDLVVASKSLSRPFWPLRSRLDVNEVQTFLAQVEDTCRALSKPLLAGLGIIIPYTMRCEFNAVRGYSTLLTGYSRGLLGHLMMGYVLELRNFIHYHVMSLPPPGTMANEGVDLSPTYGALRLGLIAYSLLVLFPVPLTMDPHPRLSLLLRQELECKGVEADSWFQMPEVLLWLLMLGGISAVGTDHRAWYVDRIHWLAEVLGVESWEQLRDIMGSILWIDSPCDIEGLILWEEEQLV
ncbi:hypothetical protein BJY04DRAFT_219745 [Aspergillus karnatakaensis]|uniref:uncharacterized protein n=1 Tax=Aspergillus karnatakaensis TaxID=1810916 RepID=UPI003CCD606F